MDVLDISKGFACTCVLDDLMVVDFIIGQYMHNHTLR